MSCFEDPLWVPPVGGSPFSLRRRRGNDNERGLETQAQLGGGSAGSSEAGGPARSPVQLPTFPAPALHPAGLRPARGRQGWVVTAAYASWAPCAAQAPPEPCSLRHGDGDGDSDVCVDPVAQAPRLGARPLVPSISPILPLPRSQAPAGGRVPAAWPAQCRAGTVGTGEQGPGCLAGRPVGGRGCVPLAERLPPSVPGSPHPTWAASRTMRRRTAVDTPHVGRLRGRVAGGRVWPSPSFLGSPPSGLPGAPGGARPRAPALRGPQAGGA